MTPEMVSKMTLLNLRIAGTILHTLALLATGFRAAHRWRRGRFFWDDVWALVAAAFDSIVLITLWVRVHTKGQAFQGHPPSAQRRRALSMVMVLAFISVIWAARISVACTILRLLPPSRTRKFVLGMIGWFSFAWLVLFVQKNWRCGKDKTWVEDCPIWFPFTIFKLCTDIMADILLVVVPVFMLWNSTLPKGPRWMIRIVFATSIVATVCSVVHAAYTFSTIRILEGYAAHFEAAITVMICNLLVIVTFCYRALRNGRDLDEDLSEYISSQTERRRAPLTVMSFTEISTQSPEDSFLEYGQDSSLFRDQSNVSSTASHPAVLAMSSSSKERTSPNS